MRQYVISNQIYFFRQKFDSEGGGKNLSLTGVCVCVCVFFGGGDFFYHFLKTFSIDVRFD